MSFPGAVLIAHLLLSSMAPPDTCLSGTIAPRVTKSHLAGAQEVVGVRVEQVEHLPYAQCRAIMLALSVERSTRIEVGQRFVVQTHCADANTLMKHADEWVYSDVPVVGEEGRFYVPRHGVTPPGSHYVAARNEALLAETAAASNPGQRDCAG